jgi:hypothetical protein
MEVFLVPVGPDRYELYCEVPDEPAVPLDEPPPQGFFRRMTQWLSVRRLKHRFNEMLAEAERERRHGRTVSHHDGWFTRAKGKIMRWVAESVAEQRLLWSLRRETDGTLFYPDDMEEAPAAAVLCKQLKRDFDKHQFWLIIDSLGFIASGALMLVPGPNILAYYFAFRLVGHFFSLRGARQALNYMAWTNTPSRPLSELRRIIHIAPEEREQQVQNVAGALRLEHLAQFFQRIAIPSS